MPDTASLHTGRPGNRRGMLSQIRDIRNRRRNPASAGANYPSVAGGQNARYGPQGVPIRDLLQNQAVGGSQFQGDELKKRIGQRRALVAAGGGGKNFRQNIYGSDFKTGELRDLKARIAFADAAAQQGQPLPGNLTAEGVAADRTRLAELLAKRKAAVGRGQALLKNKNNLQGRGRFGQGGPPGRYGPPRNLA